MKSDKRHAPRCVRCVTARFARPRRPHYEPDFAKVAAALASQRPIFDKRHEEAYGSGLHSPAPPTDRESRLARGDHSLGNTGGVVERNPEIPSPKLFRAWIGCCSECACACLLVICVFETGLLFTAAELQHHTPQHPEQHGKISMRLWNAQQNVLLS